MPNVFNCPSCGARQEQVNLSQRMIQCRFCGESIIVQPELRRERPHNEGRAEPEVEHSTDHFEKRKTVFARREHIGTLIIYTNINPTPPSRWSTLVKILINLLGFVICLIMGSLFYFPEARDLVWPYITNDTPPVVRSFWYWLAAGDLPPQGAPISGSKGALLGSRFPGYATRELQFGSQGIGPGQFQNATAITVDHEGRIFVADSENERIQVFDPQGKFLAQWLVEQGTVINRITADRKGGLYVLHNSRIDVYESMTGKQLSNPLPQQGLLTLYADFALPLNGGLVVSSYDGLRPLLRYDAQGEINLDANETLEQRGNEVTPLSRVAVDGVGNLYLTVGTLKPALLKFDANGVFVDKLASVGDSAGDGAGKSAGVLSAFAQIAVDGQGRLFVSEFGGVQVLDGDGRTIDTIAVEGLPTGLAISEGDELFVLTKTIVTKFVINE